MPLGMNGRKSVPFQNWRVIDAKFGAQYTYCDYWMQFQLWAMIFKWMFCLHSDFSQTNVALVLQNCNVSDLKSDFLASVLGRDGDTSAVITQSFIDIDVVVRRVKKQYNCHKDERNQCTWQHKAGDGGDELPWGK